MKKILTIIVCSILFFSLTQIIYPVDLITNWVSAEPERIDSTNTDFESGTLENLTLSDSGEIKLTLNSKYIFDDYKDEMKIRSKENLIIDTINGKTRLLTRFQKTFGDSSADYGHSLEPTSDGGYIIVGSKHRFDTGEYDVYLIKTNSYGNEIWNKTYGGSESDSGHSVRQTSDGGFIIVGYTESFGTGQRDGYLIKTDSYGNELWSRTFGSKYFDSCNSVEETSDGGYIIVGYTGVIEHDDIDIYVVKTDSSGYELWSNTFGGNKQDFGYSVKQTIDGGYIIAGRRAYENNDTDAWIIKTDANGNKIWDKTYGDNDYEVAYRINQTVEGGYIITCSNSDGVFLIETDNEGNEIWNKTFNERYYPYANFYSVKQTSDGGYLIIGDYFNHGTRETIAFDRYDIFLIKFDNHGNEQWNRTLGGIDWDSPGPTIELNDGGYILVGSTRSYGNGSQDVFLIKIDRLGNIFPTSGDLISTDLLSDQNIYSINTFSYEAIIPNETSIKVQFSQNNKSWYNSNSELAGWDYLDEGKSTIDLSPLKWSSSNFFYRMNFFSNSTNSSVLININLTYQLYSESGSLISEAINTDTETEWKNIDWDAKITNDTNIKFQIRTSNELSKLLEKDFVGPDGTKSTYYSVPNTTIWYGHNNTNWFQYKAYLETTNGSKSPELDKVEIEYNKLPDESTLFNDEELILILALIIIIVFLMLIIFLYSRKKKKNW
jgi:hypothetical protein